MEKIMTINVNSVLIGGGDVSLLTYIDKKIMNSSNIKTIEKTNRDISLSL